MIGTLFIIPYRGREQQKHFFEIYTQYLLEDVDPSTYEIVFAHQKNDLPFNRGAMKNIGFLYAKDKYPYYRDIVFVFNDIDTLPYKKGLLDFSLKKNEIKHYYGFKSCLGGIFAIRGSDFERINGFPSFWNWGWEDTVIYDRAVAASITINRDQYYDYGDSNILQLVDGIKKEIPLKIDSLYKNTIILDGLSTLQKVVYEKNDMLDVLYFECGFNPYQDNDIQTVYSTRVLSNQPDSERDRNRDSDLGSESESRSWSFSVYTKNKRINTKMKTQTKRKMYMAYL